MAKTLVGQLIFRLKAEGLGEANQIIGAVDRVERAVNNMRATGVPNWGVGFEQLLSRAKLSHAEIERVRTAWTALHDDIRKRGLSPADSKGEIANWRTTMVGELSRIRQAHDDHYRAMEIAAKSHSRRLNDALRMGLVALGAYTVPYFGGMMMSEAFGASAERRREVFRQKMASIPQSDADAMAARAEELGKKYPSVSVTGIMEMFRGAYATMGDAERAAAVIERMTQALVVLQSAKGPEAAVATLYSFMRGLDNLGQNDAGQKGIDQVNQLIDAATKAAQVDPDFDAATFFAFARRTKGAGAALSPDFLARASVFMQDMGADTFGNALAMVFRSFVSEAVGAGGGKKYLAAREKFGIRTSAGLNQAELLASDPDLWVKQILVPALKAQGVDTSDNVATTIAINEMTGNSTAAGLLTRMIVQMEQIDRWLALKDKATGTDAAESVRLEDPIVGWKAFGTALQNLSAAMIPIDAINAGLNSLADGINSLAAVAKNDPLGYAMVGAGGLFGAYQGGKFLLNKASDMFGLKSSALALDASAAALMRAAGALGGAGVLDGADAPDGKGKAKAGKGGLLGALGLGALGGSTVAALAGLLPMEGSTPNNPYLQMSAAERAAAREASRKRAEAINASHMAAVEARRRERAEFANQSRLAEFRRSEIDFRNAPASPRDAGTLRRFLLGAAADEGFSFKKQFEIDAGITGSKRQRVEPELDAAKLEADVDSVAANIEAKLAVTATPALDTSALDLAIRKAERLLSLLKAAGAASTAANNNAGAALRRNFADMGVGPQ